LNISHLLGRFQGGVKDCKECGGTGIYLEVNVSNFRFPVLNICKCVSEKCYVCESNGKPPYMVYDSELNKMLPCFCHEVRYILSTIERKIQESKIPPRYQFKFIESLDTKHDEQLSLLAAIDWAKTLVSEYRQTPKRQGLYLSGNTGSGKTHLACAILNELILKYQLDCRYVKINKDFLEILRASYQRESDFYGQARDIETELADIEVLLIDDFGTQKETEWSISKLYDLIDYRYEREKLTLITSNQALIELKEKSERLYSRLCEMTQEVHIDCPDYRVKISNERRS
jgi:DNA replication protein DnaC